MPDPHPRKSSKDRDNRNAPTPPRKAKPEPLEEVEDRRLERLEEVEDDRDDEERPSRSESRRSRDSRASRPRDRDDSRRAPARRAGPDRGSAILSIGIVLILLVVLGGIGAGIFVYRYINNGSRIPESDWSAFRPKQGAFTILLPGLPQESVQGELHKLIFFQYITSREKEKSEFKVSFSFVPQHLMKDTLLDDIMDGDIAGARETSSGKVLVRKPITLGPHSGREVQLSLGKSGGTKIVRIYLVRDERGGATAYVLAVSGEYIQPDKGNAARFLDSFQLDALAQPAAADPKGRPGTPERPQPLDSQRRPSNIPPVVWSRFMVARAAPFPQPNKSAAPTNYLYLVGSPGDPIGKGQSYAYSTDKMVARFTSNKLHLDLEGWKAIFSPPDGKPLNVGTYDHAFRLPSNGSPGLDFFGQGRSNSTSIGTFVVWELATNNDRVLRLAVDFVQHEGHNLGNPPLFGSIRINSTFE